jgi:phage baseplate assembly protein gpV
VSNASTDERRAFDVTVGPIEPEPDEEDRKFYGIVLGEVINLLDEMPLSRIQVRIKSIDGLDLEAWARVASPMAGLQHGAYFIPSLGDQVLVAFEHGNLRSPYVIGSVHDAVHLPPVASPLAQIRAIRTPFGNQLVFSELTGEVALQTMPTLPYAMPMPPSPFGPYHSIHMSPAGIQITSPTSIQLQVQGTTVSITPAGVVITAPAVSVIATGDASVQSLGNLALQGAVVRINS